MISSPIGKLLTGMFVCLLSICSITSLANDDIFISPYGNMNYYKKRTSEKDFSAGTDYDFSIQFARINDQSYLRTTTWKNKTVFEKVIVNDGKCFTEGYYVKTSQGLTRNETAGFTYQKADPIANYTSKDPETGIELTCSSRLYDTLFTGVLPRQALTVIKKGKGITIKEVFIEGYGLTILVINDVIYTQILGDYDIKKDMMSTLNYSDPMACVLVNQTNMTFHSNKLSELYKTEKGLAATARVSSKPALMELIQLEAKARILSANLSRIFKSTDLGVFTKSVIADYYLTASTIPIVNLEKETSAEEKNQLIAAYRQRIFISPNIDEISKDIMNGDHFVTSQKNYFKSLHNLAFAVMEPSTSHPYVKDELEYLYYINSTAEKTTRNTHPRYHQVYQNKFLLERILMLQYQYLADTTTEVYYKNGHIRNALKFAFNNLDAMTSNSDSTLNDIYVIPEDEKLVMVKILDKYAISPEIRISPEKIWALMGKLKYYDRAYEYLKLSITNNYFMYFESQYPLVAEVCNATKKNDELVALIGKYRTGTEKNEVFEKVYVYQYLNRTKEAIEAIKTSKWGTINFFVDEFAGQKVLEYAVKNKQQEILDFFYTEVFNKYELNKAPRKLVFTSDYEDLKTLVSITQKCGNSELSEKLDKYYYKSIKMK